MAPLLTTMKGIIMKPGQYLRLGGVALAITAGLASLSPGDASAGRRSDPAGLSACPATWRPPSEGPAACVVALVNPDFELGGPKGWWSYGSAFRVERSYDDWSFVAVLEGNRSVMSQSVRMPLNQGHVGGREATFAMRFRVRAGGKASVLVGYRILLVDGAGKRLGRIVEGSVSVGREWEDMESIVPRRDLPQDAHVMIEFEREDDNQASAVALVDDVSLVILERS